MGLLDRGYKVTLVQHAIQSLSEADAGKVLHAFGAARTNRPNRRGGYLLIVIVVYCRSA